MSSPTTSPCYLPCTIKVERDGDLQEVNPKDLTNSELCHLLSELVIDSEFSTSDEVHDWALAREEAVRRLKQNGETQDNVGQFYDAKPVVHAAKLREALASLIRTVNDFVVRVDNYGIDSYYYECYNKHKDILLQELRKADSALAKPARNCDMGTAEEQAKRFEEFCAGHHRKMIGNKIPTGPCECPCYEGNSCNYFVWAQMPYEEGGNDGNE